MKEYPIPFNTDMVNAILEGRKTMTRRPLKPQPISGFDLTACRINTNPKEEKMWPGARYHKELKLWVRETWGIYSGGEDGDLIPGTIPGARLVYRATDDMGELKGWKSPRFMPRWASRINLEIVDVRVERLQEITEEDAKAEGTWSNIGHLPSNEFRDYWNSLYTKKPEYQWKANPWVWALSFKKINPQPHHS